MTLTSKTLSLVLLTGMAMGGAFAKPQKSLLGGLAKRGAVIAASNSLRAQTALLGENVPCTTPPTTCPAVDAGYSIDCSYVTTCCTSDSCPPCVAKTNCSPKVSCSQANCNICPCLPPTNIVVNKNLKGCCNACVGPAVPGSTFDQLSCCNVSCLTYSFETILSPYTPVDVLGNPPTNPLTNLNGKAEIVFDKLLSEFTIRISICGADTLIDPNDRPNRFFLAVGDGVAAAQGGDTCIGLTGTTDPRIFGSADHQLNFGQPIPAQGQFNNTFTIPQSALVKAIAAAPNSRLSLGCTFEDVINGNLHIFIYSTNKNLVNGATGAQDNIGVLSGTFACVVQ